MFHDPFPGHVEQGAAIPEFVEFAVDIFRFDQDDVAIIFGVVGLARRGVGRDELLDEFRDGGVCGVIGGELSSGLRWI